MCGWQVKLCDPLVTRGPYLSALAVELPIIRRYTNNQITLTLRGVLLMEGTYTDGAVDGYRKNPIGVVKGAAGDIGDGE